MLRRVPRRTAGSTLLEVLAGLLLMSLGLLSMAALQARLVSQSDATQLRASAAALAFDLAERLRANPDGVAGGFYDGAWQASGDAPDGSASGVCAAACDPEAIAVADRLDWSAAARSRLPGAAVSIMRVPGGEALGAVDIRVAWRGAVEAGEVAARDPACPQPDAAQGSRQCLLLRAGS